jgi:hypothetical protein
MWLLVLTKKSAKPSNGLYQVMLMQGMLLVEPISQRLQLGDNSFQLTILLWQEIVANKPLTARKLT